MGAANQESLSAKLRRIHRVSPKKIFRRISVFSAFLGEKLFALSRFYPLVTYVCKHLA
jgi:hypothetical protein